MSDGMVHKWARAFKYDRHNGHDEESSGQLSVVTEDLVQKVAQKWKRTDALQFIERFL